MSMTSLVAEHIRVLREAGGTYDSIGAAAGVAPSLVHGLVKGTASVTPGSARLLLAVCAGDLEIRRVPAGGAKWRLRALGAMGHSAARISRALGCHEETVQVLVRGETARISPAFHAQITNLYDTWWDKCPPETTKAERISASAARRRAERNGWPCPAALDDPDPLTGDQGVDSPGYEPSWRTWLPATGVGVAPDIDLSITAEQREAG